MREITLEQFRAELVAQRMPSHEHFTFKCPVCKTLQTAADLIHAGADKDFDSVEKYVGFSCIGRWTNAGPYKNGAAPGKGCDWTLGGLFQLHQLVVVTPDGKKHPRFEIATPDEAKAHLESVGATL